MTERRGRPVVPMEVKRLTGRTPRTDSGGRQLPPANQLAALPAAERMPEYPEGIGSAGAELWRNAWGAGIVWLSPDSDKEAVIRACRLSDDLAVARSRYYATTDPKDGQLVVSLSRELGVALAEIGFTPLARTKLGVAEVVRVSKLDELRRRHERAQAEPAVVDAEYTG